MTEITEAELDQARQQLKPITLQETPNTSISSNINVSDDNTNTGTSAELIAPALNDVVKSSPNSNIGQKASASLQASREASRQASRQASQQNSQQDAMDQQGPQLNTDTLIAKLNKLASGSNQGQEPTIQADETANSTGETVLKTTVTVQGQQPIVTETIVEPNKDEGGPPSQFYVSDSDSQGGRRRKSYRRKPKTSTKKKQYRRRLRNTRRRQKRNTKKKHYRRMRRR
jgi:hypothetical protein